MIKRPKIRFLPILANTSGSIILSACAAAAVTGICRCFFAVPTCFFYIVACAVLLLIVVIRAKKFIICSVRLYQRFAPESVRERCVFEPTCSEYMIQAVEKYGVIKGVSKGIARLNRCHYPNGGYDPP